MRGAAASLSLQGTLVPTATVTPGPAQPKLPSAYGPDSTSGTSRAGQGQGGILRTRETPVKAIALDLENCFSAILQLNQSYLLRWLQLAP